MPHISITEECALLWTNVRHIHIRYTGQCLEIAWVCVPRKLIPNWTKQKQSSLTATNRAARVARIGEWIFCRMLHCYVWFPTLCACKVCAVDSSSRIRHQMFSPFLAHSIWECRVPTFECCGHYAIFYTFDRIQSKLGRINRNSCRNVPEMDLNSQSHSHISNVHLKFHVCDLRLRQTISNCLVIYGKLPTQADFKLLLYIKTQILPWVAVSTSLPLLQ